MVLHATRGVIFSTLSLLVCSFSALAQTTPAPASAPQVTAKTGVQIRVDSVGAESKKGSAAKNKTQYMNVSTARLGVSGEYGETIAYTLRLNLRSASGFSSERNSADGNLSALDRAIIEHRVLPALSVRFGRMPLVSGSIEADYSSIDVYGYSYFSDELAKVTPLTTGADLTYRFGTQAVTIAAFNGYYDTITDRGPQRGENLSIGLGYRGALLDGMIKPIVTFNNLSRIRNGSGTSRDEKVTVTAYAAGAQVSVAGVDIDLEYDAMSKPKYKSFATDEKTKTTTEVMNAEQTTTGIVGQIAYNLPNPALRPFVKVSTGKQETDGKDSFESSRNAVGIEWKPGPKNFRYHAAAVSHYDDAIKFDAASNKSVSTRTNSKQYIVGVTAKM
jgi:hypothetical protein